MKTNITLTKQSAETEIRAYFEGVVHLANSNEKFPVNLDEVWPLVYSGKNKATRALNDGFIENEDYITVTKNGQGGKFTSVDYFLSLSCLEYFIARKVRPVFEVYRQVFHKVAESKPLSSAEFLLQQAQLMVDQERRLSNVENKVERIMQRQQENEQELKALPLSSESVPEMLLRDKIRLAVNRYCSYAGLAQQTVWDNVYQSLYYRYHIAIKSCDKKKGESWLDVVERKGHLDKVYAVVSDLLRTCEQIASA